MNRRPYYWLVVLLAVMLMGRVGTSLAAVPMTPGDGVVPTLAPMIEHVVPGVVNISTRTRIRVQENPLMRDPFFRQFFDIPNVPREREEQSLGSGVIVDAKRGYILTNNHVIAKADEISVTLRDGRKYKAKLVGTDPASDIAVIHIEADNLTAVALGDSGQLRVGDFVVAIGNPFGLGQTVTSGIVSALGRSGLGIEGYEDFIQTDASINPGNSGGALVNLQGQLVGINTAIVGPSGGNVGIGFAIPVNMARQVMAQLIEYGEVRRGQLGVYIQDLTPELAKALGVRQERGAVVTQVAPNSPAAKAGLKTGDVVVKVDGNAVTNASDLRNTVGLMRIGQTVTLDILRDGKPVRIEARIEKAKQTKLDAGAINKRLEGAELGNISPDNPQFSGVEGVLVLKVARDSPAWDAGLRPGDVIRSVNRQPVRSVAELEAAVKKSPDGLLLNIQRDGGALFLLLQ
ncbi:MAG TPA: DegQ family serine endoprotease [Candidatus Methylomirabilis sp.]|nr:DegQ family serine endoprotease [Candidatus Methylomirabilis sp.]